MASKDLDTKTPGGHEDYKAWTCLETIQPTMTRTRGHTVCRGNCARCKDHKRSKRRRLAYKQDTKRAIQLEQSVIGDWCEIISDPLHMIVDIYYDYVDSLRPDSDYFRFPIIQS